MAAVDLCRPSIAGACHTPKCHPRARSKAQPRSCSVDPRGSNCSAPHAFRCNDKFQFATGVQAARQVLGNAPRGAPEDDTCDRAHGCCWPEWFVTGISAAGRNPNSPAPCDPCALTPLPAHNSPVRPRWRRVWRRACGRRPSCRSSLRAISPNKATSCP